MKTLTQLIKQGRFDYVNSNITEDNFPAPKEIGTDFKLFHFDRYISSEDAVDKMETQGYRPAGLYELLSWTEWNGKDYTVALGSVAEVYGNRDVPYLYRDDSKRYLGLDWWDRDWNDVYRFLAVKKCKCKTKHCKHYKSDFDKFVDKKEMTVESGGGAGIIGQVSGNATISGINKPVIKKSLVESRLDALESDMAKLKAVIKI